MDLMWLFTVPVLKLAIKIGILLAAVFLVIQIIRWAIQSKPPNPFTKDIREPRKPYQHDQKKRDAVLKQGFSLDKVRISADQNDHDHDDITPGPRTS